MLKYPSAKKGAAYRDLSSKPSQGKSDGSIIATIITFQSAKEVRNPEAW